MKNKFLSAIMAIVIIFTSFSFTAFAQEESKLVFASLTAEQLNTLRNGGRINSPLISELPDKPISNKRTYLPESFSLSKEGLTTVVGNQGNYATCWAFSALTSSETGLMKYNSNINFSESHLTYFSYASANQKKAFRFIFSDYDAFGNGGFDYTAMNSLANWYGPVAEKDFPYVNEKISENHKYDSLVHLQNVISFPEYAYEDEVEQKIAIQTLVEQVKTEMYKHKQAVDIAYLSANRKENYNEQTNAWYNHAGDHTDHAVAIVGWDDNFPKENFNNSEYIENDGAWLVQNSWGEEWGDEGFFWLSYEDVTIDYVGIYKYESRDNYENIYSHDESIQYTPIGFEDSTEIHMANVFTCSKDEVLEAVSFYTTDVDTFYTVKIYTGLTDKKDPASGALAAEMSGMKSMPGYYTEVLPEGIPLKKDEIFSVVVYVENPTQTLTAHVEAIYMEYRIQSTANVSNAGESFVSADGETWEDIHKKIITGFDGKAYMRLGNFTIKAFTSSDKYIKFSVDDGEISLSERLNISCSSADEIYYTTDGSDPITNGVLYTDSIEIKDGMVVKAVACRNGVFGDIYERSFCQAKTKLSRLIVSAGDKEIEMNVETVKPDSLVLDNGCTSISVTPMSMHAIKVNGNEIISGESIEIKLNEFSKNVIEIIVSEQGYEDYKYTFEVYVNPVSYDFEKETIIFDDSKVNVETKYYQPVSNGQSVTEWLDSGMSMSFIVEMSGGNITTDLPVRVELETPEIDFINECSTEEYSTRVYYKFSPEESYTEEKSVENNYLPVFPGETMYLQRKAENGLFASEIIEWVIPARPEITVEVEEVKKTKIILTYDENLVYYCENESPEFLGIFRELAPGVTYTISVYKPASETEFASEEHVFEVTTQTDERFEKIIANIKAEETDDSFTTRVIAFFSKIIYMIRIFWFTMCE
ncbi:MAG: hypothetical protein E7536_09845 [Ruminococcaceae bacterium]|nr:hypothetical protein [Oscillospiraceae bacterium]